MITENPYEYEEDDEEQFRGLLPHETSGTEHGGVLAAVPHTAQVGPLADVVLYLAVACVYGGPSRAVVPLADAPGARVLGRLSMQVEQEGWKSPWRWSG